MNYLFGWESAETVDSTQTEKRSNIEEANNAIGELIKSQESLTIKLAKANDDLAKANDEIKRLKYANRLQMSRCRSSIVSLRGALNTLESAVSLGLPPEDEDALNVHGTPLVSPQFIERAKTSRGDTTGGYIITPATDRDTDSFNRQSADVETSEEIAEHEADRAAEDIKNINDHAGSTPNP